MIRVYALCAQLNDLLRGSMCHIAQSFSEYQMRINRTDCADTPMCSVAWLSSTRYLYCPASKQAFSSNELSLMIRNCGVNRLNQFATFLTQHLRNSRQNPTFLALLQTLDEALYSGLALPREEEEWARANGIGLRVSYISGFLMQLV